MLPYESIHQMILPASQHFTKLIVSAEHIRLHHAGPQLLTASLREKYWIPRIRNLVKTVMHQYLTCYRFKGQATQQLMGELPSARVQPSRSFLTTGIDCWTHLTKIGNHTQQDNHKGLHCDFCLLYHKGCPY